MEVDTAPLFSAVASLAAASATGEGRGGDLPAPDPKWAVCMAGMASSELLPYDEAEKDLERRSELMLKLLEELLAERYFAQQRG